MTKSVGGFFGGVFMKQTVSNFLQQMPSSVSEIKRMIIISGKISSTTELSTPNENEGVPCSLNDY